MWTLVGPVVWVTAMETVEFPFLVCLACIVVSSCLYEVKLFLHCSVPQELLTRVLVIE